MKRRPECRRDYYDETLLYCLDDGTALLEGPGSLGSPTASTSGGSDSDDRVTEPFACTTVGPSLRRTSRDAYPGQRGSRTNAILFVAVAAIIVTFAGTGFRMYRLRT